MIRSTVFLVVFGSISLFASDRVQTSKENASDTNRIAFVERSETVQEKAAVTSQAESTSEDAARVLSDHIRARLKTSRALWGKLGGDSLTRISKFAPDFDTTKYRDLIESAVSGSLPADDEFKELTALSKKLVTESETLTSQDETRYEALLTARISQIVAEANDAAVKEAAATAIDRATPANGSAEDSGPAQVLKDNKAYDLFGEAARNDLAKFKAAQAVKYYPGGKPRTKEGFDKKSPADQIEIISKNSSDYIREKVRSGLKKSGAGPEKIDLVLSDKGFGSSEYQKNFQEFATDIVKTGGKPTAELEPMDGLSEEVRQELQERLAGANAKYNEGSNKEISRESKNLRAERLFGDAKRILKEIDPLGAEASEPTLATIRQYCESIASTRTETTDNPVASSDDIESYKLPIYRKLREIYKEMGGFGQVLGVFGLKGYFAGIIADVLARKLDRVLTGDERQKIDEWAASLATELHDSGAGGNTQQKSPLIPYPPQNPSIQWRTPAMPMLPVVPFGGAHHGYKSWHNRPAVYAVPGMGGYFVAPR